MISDPEFERYCTAVRSWFDHHPKAQKDPLSKFDAIRRAIKPPVSDDQAFRRALWAVADELVGWY